ncbi:MFS transporter [Alkalisalibacterium limincola]|uniref:Lysosomal dipeptide transporter MFSD1 n=1 Tax=Alkalisalibacterium limincola TaxID=2699169 RepID=A0A5C8KJS6_9GAMM|nr:MFS transporter [Alkalisalibacterium limincola]TXK59838.1 major facilitator superfamily domain-containing protein 1 [Alkalisalibacterium limincola]
MSTPTAGSLPRPTPLQRWLVLLFISLAMFGNYYVYDSLGPVIDLMREQLDFSYQQIGWLSTAYNIAALLVLLAGGYIIDRWGTKKAITFFAIVCLIAAALTAVSARYEVILAGRFMLGLGAEPLIVAATTVLAKWFKGKELSFAFGMNLSISRLGSASADWSTGFASPLYSNWQDPLWLATGVAAISVTAAMLYWVLEKRAEGRFDLGAADATEKLDFRRMYSFSASYWYIVALCVVFYSTVFPFRTFAIDYFQQAHGLDREAAGILSSLLPLAAIFATPLFGLWVDRVGRRSMFMAIGSLVMLPLFLMVTYLPPGPGINVVIPFVGSAVIPLTLLLVMLVLGGVFSLIPAVMWPSVAYIVSGNRLGSAYALMTFCQQLGWAVVPPIVGLLNDRFLASPENPGGYAPGMWFYTGLAATGLYFSYRLWRTERGPGSHGLDSITTRSTAEAEALKQQI